MKKNFFNNINFTEDIFNIGLLGFTIATQLDPGLIALGLYLFFIIAFFVYLQGVLVKYKDRESSIIFFILDFIKTFSLLVALTLLGLAFSFKSFVLTSFGVGALDLWAGIVWALANLKDED